MASPWNSSREWGSWASDPGLRGHRSWTVWVPVHSHHVALTQGGTCGGLVRTLLHPHISYFGRSHPTGRDISQLCGWSRVTTLGRSARSLCLSLGNGVPSGFCHRKGPHVHGHSPFSRPIPSSTQAGPCACACDFGVSTVPASPRPPSWLARPFITVVTGTQLLRDADVSRACPCALAPEKRLSVSPARPTGAASSIRDLSVCAGLPSGT